jgi:hypothetical protein
MRPALALLLCHLAALSVAQGQIRNAELGFTIAVPEPFEVHPECAAQKDFVYCWVDKSGEADVGSFVVAVQRLRGTIGREGIKAEDIDTSRTRLMSFRWKGFDIDGVRTTFDQKGVPVVSYVSQIPLRREAVQLLVLAPESQEERVAELMNSTLATIQGETNWLTREQRAGLLGKSFGKAGFVFLMIFLGVRYMRRRAEA